ncbi:MAG: transcriptional regulator, GntR family [Ramlibacter sp.]|jgi:DNA-binding FadR family transcriptional regulator|nr:transcriptional regulator, GntR family [Ramlibacter sp.]
MTAVNPIQRRKLYQDVVERLMLRIQSGEIRPGDHLPPERELMDVYGVGRPAVREALQALERSGIVEISHGERAKVVVPTARDLILQIASGTRHLLQSQPDMLDHLKEARLFLEIGTARMAAQKAGPQDIEALRARIEDQRAALTQMERFLACDMAFHREIARVSGNPIFPAVVEAVFQWAGDYYQPLVRAPGAEHLTLQEHTRLVDAIAAHDADAAEQAVRAHVTRSNELYRRIEQERAHS